MLKNEHNWLWILMAVTYMEGFSKEPVLSPRFSWHVAKICDLKSGKVCHGKDNRRMHEYHWMSHAATHYATRQEKQKTKSQEDTGLETAMWAAFLETRQNRGMTEEPNMTGRQYPYWGWTTIPLGLSKQKVLLASIQCWASMRRYWPWRSETKMPSSWASTQ